VTERALAVPDAPASTVPGRVTASHRTSVALACAAWVTLVAAVYYRQVWRLALGGLGPWPMLDGPRDPTLPFLHEAVRSAAAALGGATVLMMAAITTGLAIERLARWKLDGWSERLTVAAGVGVGTLANLGLALAMVGAYRAWVLRSIGGVIAAAGLVWWMRAWQARSPTATTVRARWRSVSRTDRVWLAIAALAALFALALALAPVVEYDAVWYHLYFPRVFLEHGRLVDLYDEYVSLYPMMWELWFGYGLAMGGPNAATLLHWAALPLSAMVIFDLTRRYGRPASPWLAAALFVTAPTVIWEGTTPYVDLAFVLHVSLVLLGLLRYRDTRRAQWLVIAALNLGFAMATKHVGLVVLAIACLLTLVIGWLDTRRLWPALRVAVALGVVSLAIPLPWYARAWVATSNPVFPELYHLFGGPPGRWDEVAHVGLQRFFDQFGRSRTLAHQLTLPWDMTMHEERYGGALGPTFLALAPLALLGLRPRRALRVSALGALGLFAVAFLVLWASPIASFQMRWVLAAVPALAVLAAVGYERLTELVPARSRAASALACLTGILLVLNLPPFTPLHEHERRTWTAWGGWLTHVVHGVPVVVIGAESRDAYLRRMIPTYGAWEAARRSLPATARVLTWSGGDHFYGLESRLWVFAPRARAAAAAPAGEEARAFELLRALGVTHILLDKRFLETNRYGPEVTWDSFALTNARTVANRYVVEYEDSRAVLYRIR